MDGSNVERLYHVRTHEFSILEVKLAVFQLVEALRYNKEGRVFDSRCFH